MDHAFVSETFGNIIDFGLCIPGKNLNLLMLRGYARLDLLALVSGPDVYDSVKNPEGTQRNLDKTHAKECLAFALQADCLSPSEQPRCFPEILLNARDLSCIEVLDPASPDLPLDISSLASIDGLPQCVRLRVHTSALTLPKDGLRPQISRVDGNHRLAGTDDLLRGYAKGEEPHDAEVFPVIAFAMLLGLDPNQEARLFRDINHEHKGMETAHLDTLTIRITPPEEMTSRDLLPLHIAHELAKEGRAFHGLVFHGGSKEGIVEATGQNPPLKINTLKTAIEKQLSGAQQVDANMTESPEKLVRLFDNFWKAVARTYPEAWRDKKSYILMQTIGLHGLAMFGGSMLDFAFNEGHVSEEDFYLYLSPLKNFDLLRASHQGVAGVGGAKLIHQKLAKHWDANKARAARLKGVL